jgi:hypothetical protein
MVIPISFFTWPDVVRPGNALAAWYKSIAWVTESSATNCIEKRETI